MYNTMKTNLIAEEKKVYLLDSSDDDIMFNAFESMLKMKFQEYHHIERIKSMDNDKVKETIIIICKPSTCRLENELDLYLQNFDEREFDNCLLVLVHNSNLGENPRVPSRNKVDHLQRYNTLHNIIDVECLMSRGSRMKILFGEEILQQFLGSCRKKKNDGLCAFVVNFAKEHKIIVCSVAAFSFVAVVVFPVVFVTCCN
ncbi:uncharacterized protein LOC132745708 [Ruditapes philippinarum]|uniref:uncharacterized protein LOC132745708 n=1 Tax=Ruditapes philippinarum TaxID=129788 RepID=UPI00295ABC32|nr:uncharacterized protein LOC132745708 [Ruditapes philippinarum]